MRLPMAAGEENELQFCRIIERRVRYDPAASHEADGPEARLQFPFPSKLFKRAQASLRALALAGLASGASPARMKPCPAPA